MSRSSACTWRHRHRRRVFACRVAAFARGYANATVANVHDPRRSGRQGHLRQPVHPFAGRNATAAPRVIRALPLRRHQRPASELSCGEIERSIGSTEDMFWSPGGTRLVMPTFTDAILAFRDTDIVVLDPETWTETNLSDDGFDDYIFGGVPVQCGQVPAVARRRDADVRALRRAGGRNGRSRNYQRSCGSISAARSPKSSRPWRAVQRSSTALQSRPDGKRVAFVFD